jgi:ribose-phosphate pyrophosphokinase
VDGAKYYMKVFSGNSNPTLAKCICEMLNVPLSPALVSRYSDGEIRVELEDNVRGADVFVIQSGSPPVNDHLMELLVLIDAMKRASARRITAVMPYYCYARQDRKSKPRVPITARLVADMVTAAGAHRLLTVDLHAGQIQGFFNIPVDNLYASPVLLPYIRENFLDAIEQLNLVIVSPDSGGVPRARAYAGRLKAGLAMIDKRREGPNQSEVMNIVGDVAGKVAIILDDMADTAGTLVAAGKTLIEKGSKEVHACVTHPILSGPAIDRLAPSPLESLVVTDTVPLNSNAINFDRIRSVSTCNLLASAIGSIHRDDSVSSLFEILH